jgi:hypothetical protein
MFPTSESDPTKRLKELEQKDSKLNRLLPELSLGEQILQDIAPETSKPGAAGYW